MESILTNKKALASSLVQLSMTVLTREEVAKIKSLSVAKAELAQYADLLRIESALRQKLEDRVKDRKSSILPALCSRLPMP